MQFGAVPYMMHYMHGCIVLKGVDLEVCYTRKRNGQSYCLYNSAAAAAHGEEVRSYHISFELIYEIFSSTAQTVLADSSL